VARHELAGSVRAGLLALTVVLVASTAGHAGSLCGEAPPVDDQSLKGLLEGKAEFLSRLVGNASLKGNLDSARQDIFSKYPNADKARSEAYLEYMLCTFVLSDPKLSPNEKFKAIQEFRQSGPAADGGPSEGNVAVSVMLNRDREAERKLQALPETQVTAVRPEQQVTYIATREGDATRITFQLQYLDLVRQGGPVNGLLYDRVPFEGEIPTLLVAIQNTTKHVITLTGAFLKIQSSRLVNEPIPIFDDMSQGCLRISNEGWSDIINPTLDMSISRDSGEVALFAGEKHSLSLSTISDSTCIPLRTYIPPELRRDQDVRVSGTLGYGPAGERGSLAFSTRVKLDLAAGQGVPPDTLYNVFFKAGETGQQPIDLQPVQEVDPEKTASFLLRVRTDRTSESRLTIDFNTIDGKTVRGGELVLDLFVPRSEIRRWRQAGLERR
jgi:hypothetical protein